MNSIHHSNIIFNCFDKLGLISFLKKSAVKHIISIMLAVFLTSYKGKTVNFALCSDNHRTTVAHFLNNGKWNSDLLQSVMKDRVIEIIYQEAIKTGKAIFFIVDDTIASHTKPSSKASHPIEDACFHQSHLKGRQDYWHQIVGIMLSCNGITLNYDLVLYDKSKSKMDIVLSIMDELPETPAMSCFPCDSWYTSAKLMNSFMRKGFHAIGAVKANRIIYPVGIKQNIKEFSKLMHMEDSNASLVTVHNREFYVYRYEGELNDIENAVVLISYPKEAFLNPNAVRAFVCTDASLSTQETLDLYAVRWNIEVFFRESKQKLALDKYQIRTSTGIKRYWLIMSLLHFMCCTCAKDVCCSFNEGYRCFSDVIKAEHWRCVYNYAKSGRSFPEFYAMAA